MTTLHDLLTVYRLHREPKWPAASKRDQSAIAVAEWVLEHNVDLDRLTAERDEAMATLRGIVDKLSIKAEELE